MKKISVLLIDDSPRFLRAATEFLRGKQNVAVVGAVDGGRPGLETACRLQPQIILLDLAMPDLPGMQMIPLLRRQVDGSGIIVLSILEAVPYREAVMALGADEFVSKRTMDADLLPAIRRVAQTHRQPTRGATPRKTRSIH